MAAAPLPEAASAVSGLGNTPARIRESRCSGRASSRPVLTAPLRPAHAQSWPSSVRARLSGFSFPGRVVTPTVDSLYNVDASLPRPWNSS